MSWSLCDWMELGRSMLFLWSKSEVDIYYKLSCTMCIFIIWLRRAYKTGLSLHEELG